MWYSEPKYLDCEYYSDDDDYSDCEYYSDDDDYSDCEDCNEGELCSECEYWHQIREYMDEQRPQIDFSHLESQIWCPLDVDWINDCMDEPMPYDCQDVELNGFVSSDDLEEQMPYDCQDVELNGFVSSEGSPSPCGLTKHQDLSKHSVVFNHSHRDKLAPTMIWILKK